MKRTPFPAIVIIAASLTVLGGMALGAQAEGAERTRVLRVQRIMRHGRTSP